MINSKYDFDDDDDEDDYARSAGESGDSEWALDVLIAGGALVGLLICIGPFLIGT